MRLKNVARWTLCVVILAPAASGMAADKWGLKKGNPKLMSAGPLAFGPDGILLVGDTKAAAVIGIATGDTSGDPAGVNVQIDDLQKAVANVLKAKPAAVAINDLAVNPLSGNIYVSVTNSGDGGSPAIVRIDGSGKMSQVSLEGVGYTKATLPDAPADKVVGEGRRRGNRRLESITDLAYTDGKVLLSGLADADAPATVRELAFPFKEADQGTRIEIFHGAHGRLEDDAVPRTFVPFQIGGEPNLLAGFTCTPLVRFPISQFKPGKKIRGTTVAELGNRNRPLDMIVYKQKGKNYLLLTNSNRGVMKISTDDIERQEGITERISGGGTAGQPYETIKSLQGIVQLDKLTDQRAVVVAQSESGALNLKTIRMP